jgi:hypothetical protein
MSPSSMAYGGTAGARLLRRTRRGKHDARGITRQEVETARTGVRPQRGCTVPKIAELAETLVVGSGEWVAWIAAAPRRWEDADA